MFTITVSIIKGIQQNNICPPLNSLIPSTKRYGVFGVVIMSKNIENEQSTSKILITGGAGFIGSHIVDRLMETGCEVVVFDNLSSGKMEFIEHHQDDVNFSLIKGDLLNTDEIDAALEREEVLQYLKEGGNLEKIGFRQSL